MWLTKPLCWWQEKEEEEELLDGKFQVPWEIVGKKFMDTPASEVVGPGEQQCFYEQ